MTLPISTAVEYLPDCSPALLLETLEILDRWSKRSEEHVSKRRARPRFPYRGTVEIASTHAISGGDFQSEPPTVVFHVTARNISQSGVGLLLPPAFVPKQMSDKTPIIFSEAVFRAGLRVTVTLKSPTRAIGPVGAEVVRARRVHNQFQEVGLRFIGKLDVAGRVIEAEQVGAADALPANQ